jgi:hypothetical protein
MQFWFLSAAFLAFGLPSHCQDLGPQDGPVIDLGYAKYKGTTNSTTGYSGFYGMRFAAAPTGNIPILFFNLQVLTVQFQGI